MSKRTILALILSVLLAAAGAASFWLDRAANPVPEQDLSGYEIRITEICTKNESIIADNSGSYRDYIELYNPGPAVDLTGCRLTDGKLTSPPMDGLWIPEGSYRVIFLADELTGFGLVASGGDCIQLLDPVGHILCQTNTTALGRDQVMLYKDGGYVVSDTPSPGFSNDAQGEKAFRTGIEGTSGPVVVSEMLPQNRSSLPDEKGAFSDVLELHNRSDAPVFLGGYCLSDTTQNRFRYWLPDIWLQPDQYLIVFSDGENYRSQEGEIHTNFGLSAGDTVVLTAPDGTYTAIEVSFPGEDVSIFLSEDGSYRSGSVSLGYANEEEGQLQFAQARIHETSALQISEVLLSSAGVPYRGAFRDVVELRNCSDETVSTRGWYLSDGADPYAYALPEQRLKPGECMVVVCSEQTTGFSLSRREHVRLIGPDYRFAPVVSCAQSQDAESICLIGSTYNSENPSIGYENTAAGQTAFLQEQLPEGLQISELMTGNDAYLKGSYGTTCDWVELYNASKEAILLSEYSLSDSEDASDRYALPEQVLAPGEYIVLFLSQDSTHLNKNYTVLPFALSTQGDRLYLCKAETVVDYVHIPELDWNAAYGRWQGVWNVLAAPTPEKENREPASICAEPVAVTAQGVYNGVEYVDVVLSGEGTIYYTTSANRPTTRSQVYTGPIRITTTTVIRAMCVAPGKQRSSVADLTYVVNENDTLPVVTLVTDPENFFSDETGIYVYGPNYEPVEPYRGANFWQDWEREVTVSLFEKDGSGFSETCGVTIYGAYSRYQPKKSLALHFRGKYGASELNYPVFGDEGVETYEALVLRAGGQDSYRARIRDELITSLAAEYTDILVQKYRPVVLYINGEYYGLHFIREKINEHFIAANCNVSTEGVVLGRANGTDIEPYEALVDYAATHDLSKQEYYEQIGTMMDIPQYMDYIVAQICIANDDNSNVRFFLTEEGKWRWILYDTDLSLYRQDYNSVEEHLNPWGTGAADYISTDLITALLKNNEFKDAFLRRLAWQMDTIWTPENLHSRINAMVEEISADVAKDVVRWYDSLESWDKYLSVLRDCVDTRYEILIPQIQEYFDLSEEQMRQYGFRV